MAKKITSSILHDPEVKKANLAMSLQSCYNSILVAAHMIEQKVWYNAIDCD